MIKSYICPVDTRHIYGNRSGLLAFEAHERGVISCPSASYLALSASMLHTVGTVRIRCTRVLVTATRVPPRCGTAQSESPDLSSEQGDAGPRGAARGAA